MKRPTMVGRVAWVQMLVTLSALGIVVVLTWLGVNGILAWKTDATLHDLLSRTVDYLDAGPDDEAIDWAWLASELDEARPRDVRFEVRSLSTSRVVMRLGSGAVIEPFERDCVDRGRSRVCGRAGRRFSAMAASDRTADLAARDQLMQVLVLACTLAAAAVALSSVAVTRRAILPLADLAKRVAAIEPGTGKTLEPKAELRELEVLETRFADLVGRFEQALAREKQFVAHASHELRTPLTVVRAEIEALANTDPGLRAALASLCRLESLIDALLWFAKAQTSFNTQEMDVVNLADVLGHQLLEVQRAHASRAISVRLPDEALVRGDEKLLASATANLLDNAIKYGGEAEIEVSLQRESENLVLRVANDGPRIPQGLRTRLFVPFVRGQHSVPGFGLGLAFSRAVARAHGGDIVLADGENERTTLLLRLPLVGWNDEVSAG